MSNIEILAVLYGAELGSCLFWRSQSSKRLKFRYVVQERNMLSSFELGVLRFKEARMIQTIQILTFLKWGLIWKLHCLELPRSKEAGIQICFAGENLMLPISVWGS